MRRKRLRRYVDRLQTLQRQRLTRDQLLMKLGATTDEAWRADAVDDAQQRRLDVRRPDHPGAALEFAARESSEGLRRAADRRRALLSAEVGTSGIAGERVLLATAGTLTLPVR